MAITILQMVFQVLTGGTGSCIDGLPWPSISHNTFLQKGQATAANAIIVFC